jgi:hypothetical protein
VSLEITNWPFSLPRTQKSVACHCQLKRVLKDGTLLEWYWDGKSEVLEENTVPVPLCPTQIPHGLIWYQTRAFGDKTPGNQRPEAWHGEIRVDTNVIMDGIAQTVWRLATGWTVWGSNPAGGKILRTRRDKPWEPPSLLHNGYWVPFPGVERRGCGVNYPPYLAPRLKKE